MFLPFFSPSIVFRNFVNKNSKLSISIQQKRSNCKLQFSDDRYHNGIKYHINCKISKKELDQETHKRKERSRISQSCYQSFCFVQRSITT